MSYQVIARKYRPVTFADVVGQEHVTTTLANAIKAGRIAHAYLLCGPRGTGKTTLARIFAKALNCTNGPSVDFDPADPRVQEIADGRSLDVLEIDGASNNGVDQVRELRETARFAPSSSRFKIYIIDEVHMLTAAAFNALLKTLEEPPAHVKFLFATTDPEKVLPTILSRCQRFDLRRIPSALIAKHLQWIAGQEGVEADPAALDAIARGADGGMRDAESALDQLISFCDNRLEESDVLSMFGLAARSQVLSLSRAILAADPEAALRGLDELARGGKDLGRLLGDLVGHFRNLLVFKVSRGDGSLVEAGESELASLRSEQEGVDVETTTRILDVLSHAESRLRDAPSRRIYLEVTLLKAIQARNAVGLDAVLRQLRQLRDADPTPAPVPASRPTQPEAVTQAAPPAAAGTPRPVVAQSAPVPPAQPPSPPAAEAPNPSPPEVWNILWEGLKREPLLRAQLTGGIPVSFSRGLFKVSLPDASYDLTATAANIAKFLEALRFAGVGVNGIEFLRQPPEPAAPAPAAAQARPQPGPAHKPEAKPAKSGPVKLNVEDFRNDPKIKEALEVFRGRLLEVRGPGESGG
jgi:DNA polymerase III subunit gamma/tau